MAHSSGTSRGSAWDEPDRFDVVLFEELEEPRHADVACGHAWAVRMGREETWGRSARDVARGGFAAVGTEPAC